MRSLLRWAAALVLLALTTPAAAAWHEARSKHFIIYWDGDAATLREFALRLEKFDKAVRLLRQMDDPPLTDSRRLTIFALRSDDAFQRLTGMWGARGMYRGRAAGSWAFLPRKSGEGWKFDLDSQSIFFHEYAHHLQLQQSSLALPAWFREGFAEFFATAQFQPNGSLLVGSLPAYRGWGLNNRATGLSFEEMLDSKIDRYDPWEFERLYAQGWFLTHYLTFNEARKGQLDRYLAGIQRGMGGASSARAAFGDLKTLERELEQYKKVRLPAVEVGASRLTAGPIAIRPLTAGEEAIIKIHMRSTYGVNVRSAPGVASDARRVAARFPNDALVQLALAEAEIDAKNFAPAERAADRALAINPNLARALIYKGRAQLGLAKENPAAADWAAVRQSFLRANKLDTENAEALMLFHETFEASGQRPTKNAVDALLYAVALAPQDDDLRLVAFRQLVADNRLPEARQMFAPIAFDPHATKKSQAFTTKVLAAMERADSKTVLEIVDEARKDAEQDE